MSFVDNLVQQVHNRVGEIVHQTHLYLSHPQTTWLALAEHAIALWFVLTLIRKILFPREGLKKTLLTFSFRWLKKIPAVKRKIAAEQAKVISKMEKEIFSHPVPSVGDFVEIPEQGIPHDEIVQKLEQCRDAEVGKWQGGKVSGAVYHGGKEMSELGTKAFGMFSVTNPLHSDLFPSVRKFEAEVVRMTASMMHGDKDSCGTMTSGGTESILMACKAYRDWGYATKGIQDAEIVCAVSAHAAFDKAAKYFKMRVVRVPVGNDYGADVAAMERAITRNTVMIVGSAPEFPHGIIDDIEGLAKVAKRHRIGLHVDCCLGGFFLPFAELEGFPIPKFDFRVDGVTSISADTHKYGYATKGSSVILYRDPKLRAFQFFVAPDWTGGIYASPSIAGSRAGGLIAACWAAMLAMGQDGYRENVRKIMESRIAIQKGIEQMDDLYVLGKPQVMVVSFAAKEPVSTYAVGDAMSARGWNLNSLQYPPSIHICCTRMTVNHVDEFLADLREAVAEAKSQPGKYKDGAGAIYGLAASIPDRTLVDDLARAYMDVVLQTKPTTAAAAEEEEGHPKQE